MKNKIQFSLMPKSIGRGMLCIYVKAAQHGRSVLIDTNVHIFKDEWNDDSGLVVNNPNAKLLNKQLRQTVYDLETMEFDSDGHIGLSKLKRTFESREMTEDFYTFIERTVPHRDIRESTKQRYYDFVRKLRKFRDHCSIGELSEEWAKDYYRWSVERGDAEGTTLKDMQSLRAWWSIARKTHGNKMSDDMFDWYRPNASRTFRQKGLDNDDIRMIENFVSIPGQNQIYIDIMEQFLFMSYTGCRFSDFNSLTRDCFKTDNGRLWLSYVSVKTRTPVHIPLFALFDGRAEQLYYKHLPDFDKFFRTRKNSHYNLMLKKICRMIGLEKRVTSHVARHTCATRLINKDIPATTIQKVVGHRKIEMTMRYAHTNDTALVRQLSR